VQGATGIWVSRIIRTKVSIHAPVQGATESTSPYDYAITFQSTPPCRGRRCRDRVGGRRLRFNPRPRAGGDCPGGSCRGRLGAFQSTPPCRGRPGSVAGKSAGTEFQSTPPCRGRPMCSKACDSGKRFQSTPPCRGRLILVPPHTGQFVFQSTPPCRGRPMRAGIRRCSVAFQSTPPCRGRRGRAVLA